MLTNKLLYNTSNFSLIYNHIIKNIYNLFDFRNRLNQYDYLSKFRIIDYMYIDQNNILFSVAFFLNNITSYQKQNIFNHILPMWKSTFNNNKPITSDIIQDYYDHSVGGHLLFLTGILSIGINNVIITGSNQYYYVNIHKSPNPVKRVWSGGGLVIDQPFKYYGIGSYIVKSVFKLAKEINNNPLYFDDTPPSFISIRTNNMSVFDIYHKCAINNNTKCIPCPICGYEYPQIFDNDRSYISQIASDIATFRFPSIKHISINDINSNLYDTSYIEECQVFKHVYTVDQSKVFTMFNKTTIDNSPIIPKNIHFSQMNGDAILSVISLK